MTRSGTFDVAAMGLSGLCLAHCLALPLLAASLPLLGSLAEAEWVHLTFVLLAAPVSLAALAPGKGARPWRLFALAGSGMAALTGGVVGWPTVHAETSLTVIGSVALVAAHFLNWRRGGHGLR